MFKINETIISNLATKINEKEKSSNKVSSWSGTTTDAHYPSEKLVKDSLDAKSDSTHTHNSQISYGKVNSTSTSTVFTATVPNVTTLTDGTTVMLRNGVVTSAAGFTLNVNGLGAKPVYSSMADATADTTIFNINYTMLFVYDTTRISGGCWICYRGYNSDNNTLGYQIRTNSQKMYATDKTYRYRLLLEVDSTHYMPVNTSTSTAADTSKESTMNTREFRLGGKILYYGYSTAINANAQFGNAYHWQQYALALGYSFNNTSAALALTQWSPVYMVAEPSATNKGMAKLASPYYTQTLPNTEDGKLYIYLGQAYSATNIELTLDHPIFEYKNGGIRLYRDYYTTDETDDLLDEKADIIHSHKGTYEKKITTINRATPYDNAKMGSLYNKWDLTIDVSSISDGGYINIITKDNYSLALQCFSDYVFFEANWSDEVYDEYSIDGQQNYYISDGTGEPSEYGLVYSLPTSDFIIKMNYDGYTTLLIEVINSNNVSLGKIRVYGDFKFVDISMDTNENITLNNMLGEVYLEWSELIDSGVVHTDYLDGSSYKLVYNIEFDSENNQFYTGTGLDLSYDDTNDEINLTVPIVDGMIWIGEYYVKVADGDSCEVTLYLNEDYTIFIYPLLTTINETRGDPFIYGYGADYTVTYEMPSLSVLDYKFVPRKLDSYYANQNVIVNNRGNIDFEEKNNHTHSQYLTEHQSLTNYVQKSQTAGLLKNDGSVDTSTYLTSHQSLTGYLQTSDVKDNLTSTDTDKPLSAKQGKVLNDLIGDIVTIINGSGGGN